MSCSRAVNAPASRAKFASQGCIRDAGWLTSHLHLQMRTIASTTSEAAAVCSTSLRCYPLRHAPQCSRIHPAALRQRAAGSLSPGCIRTLASRSASSRRSLHVTAAAATLEAKEETFTYQAEVCGHLTSAFASAKLYASGQAAHAAAVY